MSASQTLKTEQRAALRQRRSSLSEQQQREAAGSLPGSVKQLPDWTIANRIALYMANDGEIDTEPLAAEARSAGKEVFLPIIREDQHLEFARWVPEEALQKNRYGIPEPPPNATRCPLSNLDVLFLPLVGWDVYGGRLGMGGGFYDRTLDDHPRPLLVGLAHDCQRVEKVAQDNWDVKVDFVATEAALYQRREREA